MTAFAADPVAPTKDVAIEWYQPTYAAPTRKDRLKIVLAGKTVPNTIVDLAGKDITTIDDKGRVEILKSDDVFPDKQVKADKRGMFDLQLDLPSKSIQLPIRASSGANLKTYQVNFKVGKHEIKMLNLKSKASPYARRNWGFWAGAGVNFLRYNQTTTIPSSLTLQSFDAPSYFFKVWKSFGQEFAAQATFNQSPGIASSSPAITVQQGSYNWTYYTADVTYFRSNWKLRYKKYFTEMGAQAGVQYHQVPFIARSSTTDQHAASVEIDNIVMAAIGGTWLIHYDRYWLFETFLRYQYPISSSPLFDIQPKFAFDGSVGLIYKYRPDFRFGLFWYGQCQEYGFTNHKDTYFQAQGQPSAVSGSQELLFSNLEFRLGWEFD